MKESWFPFEVPEERTCPSQVSLALSLVEEELAKEARVEIEAHLLGCARCRQRLSELKHERHTLYTKHPTLGPAAEKPRWWRPVLAGVCASTLLLFGLWFFLGGAEEPSGIRFKGEPPSLLFRVERQGRVFPGRSHMHLLPGDRIRFAYSIGEDAYLSIVNLDNQGRITPYYPSGPGESIAVQAGVEVFLAGSIRLDDYPGKERIFAIFTRIPLRFDAIESAIRKAGERMKPDSFDIEKIEALPLRGHQVTMLITKVKSDG